MLPVFSDSVRPTSPAKIALVTGCSLQSVCWRNANLAKLQIGRIASAGQSSDNRQPTPYQCFPNPIGVTGLVAYRTLTKQELSDQV